MRFNVYGTIVKFAAVWIIFFHLIWHSKSLMFIFERRGCLSYKGRDDNDCDINRSQRTGNV